MYTWKHIPLTIIHSSIHTMSWSDFEIPQFFPQILSPIPQIGSICGVFNQALENRPVVFYSTRGSKDNAITICWK